MSYIKRLASTTARSLVLQTKEIFEETVIPSAIQVAFRESYSVSILDGGSMWYRVTTEPTHPGKMRSRDRFLPDGTLSSANGGWWELSAPTVRPANFGGMWYPYLEATWTAVGKIAATSAITDAVAYMAATGAALDHPGAIYVSLATMVLTPLKINNIGTLYVDMSLAAMSLVEGNPTAVSLIGATPTLIGTLTADLRLPSNPFNTPGPGSNVCTTLHLSSVANLAVNDIVIITSTYNLASGNVTSYSTQPIRVMAINIGALTITTYDEVWNSYLVADASTIYKFDTRTTLNISGEFRLYGGGFRAQGDNTGQVGFFGIYNYNNRYNRITTFDVQHGAYSEWNSIGTFGKLIDYHGCNAPGIDPVTGGANTAYSVGCAGSYDAYYGDVIANRARHGFTNSVSPANYGRWCGNNQRIGKMRLKEMFGGGFDGHPGVGMTYCESLETEYNPEQADTGSSQVCLSQGAGYQIGMIRVNGRCPSRGAAFESYGWRTMTFLDPTDPAGVPLYLYEPTAWIGSFIMDGGCSGDIAQINNLTNQSGLVSPQRCHLQIDNIAARGSSGVNAKGTQGEAHIVINGGYIVAYADILHMSSYSTTVPLVVTGAADNGSGLIRLTVASTSGLYDGNVATVAAVGGVPNATGTWVIDVISATTFNLVGSTFAGAYTSGGTASVNVGMPNSIRTNNVDLLYWGTSAAGINADIDMPSSSFAGGTITMRNGTYRSRRGQTASANNILIYLNDVVETIIDAIGNPTTTAPTHTIANGGLIFATNKFGYSNTNTGAVTQGTDKSTAVALAQPAGAITMNAANLNADTAVSFVLTSAYIAANDLLSIQHVSGGTAGSYLVTAVCAAGTATITVRNITPGNLAEAIVLRYALIKESVLTS